MNIRQEVHETDVLIGTLAAAFTLLALAPYDSWNHEGTPAQMAAYVVQNARNKGDLGMLQRAFGL